jgi:membrane protein YdbS with pleckstrin-like domain
MNYIDESLAANEELIYRARFHWLQKAWAYITLAVIVVIAVGSLALVQGVPALIIAAAIAVLGLVIFVAMMTPIWTTEIGVTNHRFIFKRGWLSRMTDELQLSSIEEVNLEQGAFGRLLDYGRLVLHGTGVNDIQLPPLADPVGLRRALQEGMGAAKAAVVVVPQPADGAPQSSVTA